MKITKKQREALTGVLRELGRLGGKASAEALTPAERKARARKAGKAGGRGRANKGGTK